MENPSGFVLQNKNALEERIIIDFANKNNIKYIINYKKDFPTKDLIVNKGWIPFGSFPWTEFYLDANLKADYFPDFLKPYIKRKIWYSDKWTLEKGFVKPADKHKRFDGFVTLGGYSKKKKGPLVYSEIVHFINEWRFYVINGNVVAKEWYDGFKKTIAPKIDIEWPKEWSGIADFGELQDGSIELVETGPPIAFGWYGTDNDIFINCAIDGWKWTVNNLKV